MGMKLLVLLQSFKIGAWYGPQQHYLSLFTGTPRH